MVSRKAGLKYVAGGGLLLALFGLGAGCGFLTLETIGLPFMAAALLLIFMAGRGRGSWLSLMLGSFGLGYTAIVTWFFGADLPALAAEGRSADIAWFALLLVSGTAIILVALGLEVRRPYR